VRHFGAGQTTVSPTPGDEDDDEKGKGKEGESDNEEDDGDEGDEDEGKELMDYNIDDDEELLGEEEFGVLEDFDSDIDDEALARFEAGLDDELTESDEDPDITTHTVDEMALERAFWSERKNNKKGKTDREDAEDEAVLGPPLWYDVDGSPRYEPIDVYYENVQKAMENDGRLDEVIRRVEEKDDVGLSTASHVQPVGYLRGGERVEVTTIPPIFFFPHYSSPMQNH
jgi:hypothetical protein